MPAMQADQTSVMLRTFAERFVAAEVTDADALAMQELMRGWDGSMPVDAVAPLVCSRVRDVLARLTVHDYYEPVSNTPPMPPADRGIVYNQLTKDAPLMLGDFASWDAAVEQALSEAAVELRVQYGEDSSQWHWGLAHQMSWRHNLGRDPELAALLNLPDVEIGGDATTIFNTSTPVGITGAHGVSYRQIFDLSDLNAARICIPPGNSGQPGSPHYGDNIERWRDVDYHPLFVEWSDIEANAEAELRLTPA
jgi:penicillin amidase